MKIRRFVVVLAMLFTVGEAFAQVRKGIAAGAQTEGPGSTALLSEIDRIVLGAPVGLRAEAAMIKWRPDFTYETIKKGSNKLVCFDRSDEDRRYTFAAQCTAEGSADGSRHPERRLLPRGGTPMERGRLAGEAAGRLPAAL